MLQTLNVVYKLYCTWNVANPYVTYMLPISVYMECCKLCSSFQSKYIGLHGILQTLMLCTSCQSMCIHRKYGMLQAPMLCMQAFNLKCMNGMLQTFVLCTSCQSKVYASYMECCKGSCCARLQLSV